MAAPSDWSTFLAAIRAQESGGNYSEDTAGCLGGYCWNAQTNWDSMAKAAGQSQYVGVNPSQVPAAVQDKVASTNLYREYQAAGGGTNGLAAAARWWNGGSTQSEANPGLPAQPWAPQCGGGSSQAYACQVLTRMRLGGHYLAGGGSGSGGVVTTAAAATADCALGFNGSIPIIPGIYSQSVSVCFLTKSNARALLSVLVMASGGVLIGFGLALTAVWSAPGRAVINAVSVVVPEAKGFGAYMKGASVAQRAAPQPGPGP